jgi:hypothetical protein
MVRALGYRLVLGSVLMLGGCAPVMHLPPPPQGFVAMPVRRFGFGLNKMAMGPFRTVTMRDWSGFRVNTGLDLGFIRLFNFSSQRQTLRFVLTDAQGHMAETAGLNQLKLHSSIGDLGMRPSTKPNEVNWYARRNSDVFKATITLKEQAADMPWKFEIENAHQLKGLHVEGEVTDGTRLIRLLSVEHAVDFAREGHMEEAVLAAHIQRGMVFRYENQLVGALDQTRPDYPVFWVRPELDPMLQFVLANSAVLLVRHANLR